ncbi:hypothetical protein WME73_04025 [Sorangium sp. So ce302]|uniref:hypothetical protein n=1 Tax=Sorangium sp. So ce302 TaxID=3133297 RepID=UPI003F5E8D65
MDFHSFTYGAKIYAGEIHNFEYVEGVMQFAYDYLDEGVPVHGSFTGEDKGDKVIGTWKEQGPKRWQGSAELNSIEADRRRLFFGTWMDRGETGRWTLDVAAC